MKEKASSNQTSSKSKTSENFDEATKLRQFNEVFVGFGKVEKPDFAKSISTSRTEKLDFRLAENPAFRSCRHENRRKPAFLAYEVRQIWAIFGLKCPKFAEPHRFRDFPWLKFGRIALISIEIAKIGYKTCLWDRVLSKSIKSRLFCAPKRRTFGHFWSFRRHWRCLPERFFTKFVLLVQFWC